MRTLVLNPVHPLTIPVSVAKDLRYLAIEGYPYEVCGVVYDHNIVVQYPNTYCGDKQHGFDMEVDIVDADVVAIWHSHPHGPDMPSNDDLPCINFLSEHGFSFHHIIVTTKEVFEYEAKIIDGTTSAA